MTRVVRAVVLAYGLLALWMATPGWAADVCATDGAPGQDPIATATALEHQQQVNPGDIRSLWSAASVLRCSLPNVEDMAERCLRAGTSKALYDKFLDEAAGPAGRSFKREIAEARKSGEQLRGAYAESCAELALRAAKDGQHGPAAQLYESVFVLTYRPLLLFNAGRACELGSLWSEAAVYYTAYLALPIPWRDRRDAVGKLVQIQRRLASDTGDLVRKAEQLALAAQQGAQQAGSLAQSALQQAKAADQRAQYADQRAQGATQLAQQADQRAQSATQLAQSAGQKAQSAESRAYATEQRLAPAESRARQAEERAAQAQRQVQDLQQRLAGAEQEIRALQNALGSQPPGR